MRLTTIQAAIGSASLLLLSSRRLQLMATGTPTIIAGKRHPHPHSAPS